MVDEIITDFLDDELDDEELESQSLPSELYEHQRVVADSGQNPVRVDRFLVDHLRDTSRNRIQKAAEAGFIQANGKAVKSNYKVKAGDVITLMLDRPKRDWEIIPEEIPLDIVYEDDILLVINKPAGMVVYHAQKIRSALRKKHHGASGQYGIQKKSHTGSGKRVPPKNSGSGSKQTN